MSKATPTAIKGDKAMEDLSLSPLSIYNDQAAKDLEGLRTLSESLASEKERLAEEVERLTAQLAVGDRKTRIKELHNENARVQEAISEISDAIPRLKKKTASFHFDFDPATLEDDFERLSSDIRVLNAKKESLSLQLSALNSDNSERSTSIKRDEARLSAVNLEQSEVTSQSEGLASRITGFERLMSSLRDQTKASENPYSQTIMQLSERINKRESGAFEELRSLSLKLSQEFGHLGQDVRDLFQDAVLKHQFIFDIEQLQKETTILAKESETLQADIKARTLQIEEIKTLTTEDKKRTEELDGEIKVALEEIKKYAAELSKGKEAASLKDSAIADFKELLSNNAAFSEGIKRAATRLRRLRDTVRKMA